MPPLTFLRASFYEPGTNMHSKTPKLDCDFVTCDIVTLRWFIKCGNRKNRILLLYILYIIYIIIIYNNSTLHFWKVLNVTKSHVTKSLFSAYYVFKPTCLSKKPIHLSYKPSGLQVRFSGERYKPFSLSKQPIDERNI